MSKLNKVFLPCLLLVSLLLAPSLAKAGTFIAIETGPALQLRTEVGRMELVYGLSVSASARKGLDDQTVIGMEGRLYAA